MLDIRKLNFVNIEIQIAGKGHFGGQELLAMRLLVVAQNLLGLHS